MENLLFIAIPIFLLAGTIKGAIGIGLPTTAISLLSQFTEPRIAIAVGLIPVLLSNVWQVYRAGNVIGSFRRYWIFLSVLALSIYAMAGVALSVTRETLMLTLGASIVAFAAASLVRQPPEIPDRRDRIAQAGFGLAGGIMGGMTAIWGPAMVIYLLGRRVAKDEFVRAIGLMILAGVIPLSLRFSGAGVLDRDLALWSLAMFLPTLAGFTLGEKLRGAMSPKRFQTAVLIMFLIMGLNLIRKALIV